MTHFIDYTSNISKQTFSAAAITDRKGNMVGKIIVRFTDSQIGYNHQVGVLFYNADLDFSETLKGGTYNQPDTLFTVLTNANIKCYDWHQNQITARGANSADSLSSFNDIRYIKHNRKTYTLNWVL
jgi:hypothetical protein